MTTDKEKKFDIEKYRANKEDVLISRFKKNRNTCLVAGYLLEKILKRELPFVTLKELSNFTGLTRQGVYHILNFLHDYGMISISMKNITTITLSLDDKGNPKLMKYRDLIINIVEGNI